MRLRDHLALLARRGGAYLNRARRSVWVHGRDPEDFEAVRPVLKWLRTGISAERLLLTSDRPQTCIWLRARYPNDNTLPPPFDLGPLMKRFFRQLRPVMIVLLGDDSRISGRLTARALLEGVPLVLVDTSAKDLVATIGLLERTINKIPSAREPIPDRTAPRRMDELARSAFGRLVVTNRSLRRLDGWESLRTRLGYPETILCLGNGPSSEDPRLGDLSYDALFRVNWRWSNRGILTRPDMVFVGDLGTTARISSSVFGFRTIAWESEILLRHLLFHLSLRRLEYFTYQRVSPQLDDDRWTALPTNGVVMVATAVGLQPKKIIVGGMDLYRDLNGRYPGDTIGDNDYPQMHSREVEVRALSSILAQFSGETLILSEPLREALAAVPLPSAMETASPLRSAE
jgi:hypothetical protein